MGDYRYLTQHTLSPAKLRRAAMRAVFNVSSIVRGKVTRRCPQTTIFEEKGEPKRIRTGGPSAYQPNALPLGQTGSLDCSRSRRLLKAPSTPRNRNRYGANGQFRR